MKDCDHDWGLTVGSTCPACEIERLERELEQERLKRMMMEESLIAVSKLVSGFVKVKSFTNPKLKESDFTLGIPRYKDREAKP